MDRKDIRQDDPLEHYIFKHKRNGDVNEVSENLGICHEALAWTKDFLGKRLSVTL